MDSNAKINSAIGLLMQKVKRSGEAEKPAFKRALNNLNAARQVNDLGYPQFALPLIRIAHMLVMGQIQGHASIVQMVDDQMPAVELPGGLNKTISRSMRLIKAAKTEPEKAEARLALQHFNLSRVVLNLGYDKLAMFLVRAGERRLKDIDLTAPTHYPDDNQSDDLIDLGHPKRPAPPAHPNPVIRKFDQARHSFQTALDRFGIIT